MRCVFRVLDKSVEIGRAGGAHKSLVPSVLQALGTLLPYFNWGHFTSFLGEKKEPHKYLVFRS
jgi:hypothetical protein